MAGQWLLIVALCLFIPMLHGGCESAVPQQDDDTQQVTIDGRKFTLELALDQASRYKGLGGRDSIAEDGGMLFVFPYAFRTHFVMRDCRVPIDIIFLDSAGRVIAMHQMEVEPPDTPEHELKKYPSKYPTQFVIELKGGMLNELDIELGDKIELPYEALKERAR